mmetsp:Transcript_25515/g.29435  ORF Transcript_25515/g.29435 Transcript_25515/m.29435 type:complete len:80 (+) Transcript_25515:27-266(+)
MANSVSKKIAFVPPKQYKIYFSKIKSGAEANNFWGALFASKLRKPTFLELAKTVHSNRKCTHTTHTHVSMKNKERRHYL